MKIELVRTGKQRKQFLEFANQLYKGNEYFVPTMYMSDAAVFKKNYYYYETCEAEYFLCYGDDGKVLGRISAFVQKASNEKMSEKRARFHFFDCVNDQAVADALFDAAVKWSKDKGMTKICGPMGFSDLEREGLLIEGFDYMQTFEEQYNYEYYKTLIENYGFVKDVDWFEYQLRSKDPELSNVRKIRDYIFDKYGLHLVKSKSVSDYLKRYGEKTFDCIDAAYSKLYGTVPISKRMRDEIVGQFKLVLQNDCIMAVADKDENLVAFGFGMANIGEAMRLDGGHLTPRALIKLLKTIKKPTVIDLGLVAVLPEYQGIAINSFFIVAMNDFLVSHPEVDHFETNLNLEENYVIHRMWKHFDAKMVKKRRSYVLDI